MDNQQQWQAGQGGIRASDAEREEVVAELKRHHVDGRLDWDEFSTRMDRVYAARTRDELGGLLGDLPRLPAQLPAPAGPAAVADRGRRPAPPVWARVAAFVGVLWLLSAVTSLMFGGWGWDDGPGWDGPRFPLFPILLIAFLVIRARNRRRDDRHHRELQGHRDHGFRA